MSALRLLFGRKAPLFFGPSPRRVLLPSSPLAEERPKSELISKPEQDAIASEFLSCSVTSTLRCLHIQYSRCSPKLIRYELVNYSTSASSNSVPVPLTS